MTNSFILRAAAENMASLEKKILDCVLPVLKKLVEEGDDLQTILDNGMDETYLYEAWGRFVKDEDWDDSHAKLEKKLSKMSLKAWSDAFKAKYGISDKDILKKAEKAANSKLSTDEFKLMKYFGEFTISTFSALQDLDPKNENRIKIYMKPPDKLVMIRDSDSSMLVTDESLKKFNMTIEKVIAMFARFGIKLGKRPVVKRRPKSYSYYD